jgi:hypothetical protein
MSLAHHTPAVEKIGRVRYTTKPLVLFDGQALRDADVPAWTVRKLFAVHLSAESRRKLPFLLSFQLNVQILRSMFSSFSRKLAEVAISFEVSAECSNPSTAVFIFQLKVGRSCRLF